MRAWRHGRSCHGIRIATVISLLCGAAALGCALCTGEDLSISASCDPQVGDGALRAKVTAGRKVTVTITATWSGTDGAKYIISEATFPKLRNLELVESRSVGDASPSSGGSRFERKLTYTFVAKEPGEAETGPNEVKYYQPQVKGEKVASADEKKEPTAPLVRTLPSITIKVTQRATSAVIPLAILACAGAAVIFFALRLLRTPKAQ
jgi:hypothetical protein